MPESNLKKFLISSPHVARVELDETCEFLVLVCDGITDVMGIDGQIIVGFVYEALARYGVTAQTVTPEIAAQIARDLVADGAFGDSDKYHRRVNRDNVTAEIIFFRPL
jgi:serine/threonine protein phosphatase PrpC